MEKIKDMLASGAGNFLSALVILIVGIIVIRLVMKALRKLKRFEKLDQTMTRFILNFIKWALYVLLIIAVIGKLGVPMTEVIAVLASAGLAVGLALQGALSNLVGGLTLLILKPIKSGEFVKIGDYEGTVLTIGAFYTDLRTFDNRHISLPNNTLTNTAIVNYTREGTRRVDMTYSVSYASDLDMVYAALSRMIGNCASVLPDPAPTVVLQKCADSSVDFTVRAWVKAEDYWNVYFYMTDAGKRALDEAGIEIPFPQMDVHIR